MSGNTGREIKGRRQPAQKKQAHRDRVGKGYHPTDRGHKKNRPGSTTYACQAQMAPVINQSQPARNSTQETKQIDTNQHLMDGHEDDFYRTVQPFVAYCSSEIAYHSNTS